MGIQAPRHGTTRLRLAGAAVLLGLFMIHQSLGGGEPPAPPTPAAVPAPHAVDGTTTTITAGRPGSPPAPASGPALPASLPTRLVITKIGVYAPFTRLHLNRSGAIEPPRNTDSNLVGWYGAGPTPGERGTSVVLGHVDTKLGPAVFWGLGSLKRGDKVEIHRSDATVAHFTVDSVEVFSKKKFPDARVYGDQPTSQLRLITCGGTYDHKRRDYTANVVVFAHLASYRKG
jgi:LPXTG-site transpeptidase (sortase) family protein